VMKVLVKSLIIITRFTRRGRVDSDSDDVEDRIIEVVRSPLRIL